MKIPKTAVISIVICLLGGITAYYFLDRNLIAVIIADCIMVGGFLGFIYEMLAPHMKGR